MRYYSFFSLICLSLILLSSCSKEDDEIVEEETVNSIQIELEAIIAERDVEELWALSLEQCDAVSFYSGTPDFELTDNFIRILDSYYKYESLVRFQVDNSYEGNQMLLCFN